MKYVIDDIAEYLIWIVSDFAQKYGISNVQAYDYLKQYKAIDFVQDYYDVLHTFSFEQAVDDVSKYCVRMGGQLI